MSTFKLVSVCIVSSFFLVFGCGKKNKEGDAAQASFSFGNKTSLALTATATCQGTAKDFSNPTCYTPTVYGMKMLQVYVSADQQGATSAPAGLIWKNSACSIASSTSTIDSKDFTYDYTTDGCTDDIVTTYFDLARTTDVVNAELASTKYKILPGTYNYVQMAFCIGGAKSKNIQFQAEGMTSPHQITRNTCGISSTKADPPLVVAEGESVTVSLNYDLSGIIFQPSTITAQDYCYANDALTLQRCFASPVNLTPSMVKK